MSVLAEQNLHSLVLGHSPMQMSNAHTNIASEEALPIKDSYFIIAVGNDDQFQKFCAVVGLSNIVANASAGVHIAM